MGEGNVSSISIYEGPIVKDLIYWITYIDDLFIEVKVRVEPAIFLDKLITEEWWIHVLQNLQNNISSGF